MNKYVKSQAENYTEETFSAISLRTLASSMGAHIHTKWRCRVAHPFHEHNYNLFSHFEKFLHKVQILQCMDLKVWWNPRKGIHVPLAGANAQEAGACHCTDNWPVPLCRQLARAIAQTTGTCHCTNRWHAPCQSYKMAGSIHQHPWWFS